MKRPLLAALLLTVAVEASADLTISGANYEVDDQGSPAGPREPYTMYVRDGRMRMDSGDRMTMLIRPAAGSDFEMVVLDHTERQAIVVTRAQIDAAEGMVDGTTESSDVRVVGSGGEPILGYDVIEVAFEFVGDASLPQIAGAEQLPPEMAELMTLKLNVNGTAWVARDIEGVEELTSLYERLNSFSALAGGGMSGGLGDVMALVSAQGFPLKTTTTSEVRIEVDPSSPMAAMLQSMMSSMPQMKSTTVSEVTEISTGAVDAGMFFDGVPDGYTQTALPALGR